MLLISIFSYILNVTFILSVMVIHDEEIPLLYLLMLQILVTGGLMANSGFPFFILNSLNMPYLLKIKYYFKKTKSKLGVDQVIIPFFILKID